MIKFISTINQHGKKIHISIDKIMIIYEGNSNECSILLRDEELITVKESAESILSKIRTFNFIDGGTPL